AAGPARAVPWKSGASAPRKAIKIQFGFSPRESLSVAARENDSQELKPVLSRTSDAALKRRSSTVAHAAETVVRASGTVAETSKGDTSTQDSNPEPQPPPLSPCRQLMMALGLGNPILPDLIQQRLVADLQQRRGLLAIPVGLLQRMRDGLRFGFVLGSARY